MLRSHRPAAVVLVALVASLLWTGTTVGATAARPVSAPARHAAVKPTCRLKRAVGISSKTISIANVSDISGPVPGLNAAAQQGVKAFVAYFNKHGLLCGHTLSVTEYDSKTDAGADQQDYTAACADNFAAIGSLSGFDSGGASVAQSCGLPDLDARITTTARRGCKTCFTTHPLNPAQVPNALASVLTKSYGGGQRAAMLHLDSADTTAQAMAEVSAETKRGMHFVYQQAVATTEFSYAPYVQAMKSAGVQTVQFVTGGDQSAIESLAMAMNSQGFHPKVLLEDTSIYNSTFKDYGINTVISLDSQPFEATKPSRELRLYRHWLSATAPHATPTIDGLYAWSAARLFVTTAAKLGSSLTRASLIAAFRKVTAWQDNGLHAPQAVGTGATAPCLRFLHHTGTTWVPAAGRRYHCTGITTVS